MATDSVDIERDRLLWTSCSVASAQADRPFCSSPDPRRARFDRDDPAETYTAATGAA